MRFEEPHILCAHHILFPTREQRECAARRTTHTRSLSHAISHKTGEITCGSSSRTFSLPLAYCLLQYRRENVWFFEPHILSARSIQFPTREQRNCAARRTAHSLCLSRTIQFSMRQAENVRFLEPHVLCLSCTVPNRTPQRMRFLEPHILSACRVSFPTRQQREYEVLRTSRFLPVTYCLRQNGTENMRF